MASCVSVLSSSLVAAPVAAVVSSRNSVSFNNGGMRTTSLVSRSYPARSLCLRASNDPRKPDDENVLDKVKNAVSDMGQGIQDALPNTGSKEALSGQDAVRGYNASNQSAVGPGSPGRKPGVGRQGQPDQKSSTGGVTEAAKEMAEKTAATFDGVKEDVMSKLQDAGRDLKSKTGDVNYGSHRNADGVSPNNARENQKAQSDYTKSL